MLLKRFLFAFMLFITSNFVYSQSDSDDYDSVAYLNWANDFFVQTDYYFSNGLEVGIVKKSKKPILSKRINFVYYDHISVVQDFFTPTDIDDKNVRIGDRPYAAYLYGSYQKRIFATKQKLYFNPEIILGIIGQGALGRQLQTFTHEISPESKPPQGWEHQIVNDLVLNMNFGLEKGLFQNEYFLLNAFSKVRLGTLYSDLSFGTRFRVGKSNDFFQSYKNVSFEKPEKWQLYFEFKPALKTVAYNATMQGGMFNEKSPYTIHVSEITRLVATADFSLNVSYKKFSFNGTLTWNSKEFESASSHQWITLGFGWGILKRVL